MRHEAVGVTESLIESAENEFLQYGFKDASVRRISAASGVSTNSIYTRFGDKAGLFRAIVQEAADGLMDIYLESIHRAEEALSVENAIRESYMKGLNKKIRDVEKNASVWMRFFPMRNRPEKAS